MSASKKLQWWLIHKLGRSLDESGLAAKLTSQGFPTVPALACAPDGATVAHLCDLDLELATFLVIKAKQQRGAIERMPSTCQVAFGSMLHIDK
jgi:hypothetical protein